MNNSFNPVGTTLVHSSHPSKKCRIQAGSGGTKLSNPSSEVGDGMKIRQMGKQMTKLIFSRFLKNTFYNLFFVNYNTNYYTFIKFSKN